jgi:DNA-directed RNA polymerase subunit RPC12/RpoP
MELVERVKRAVADDTDEQYTYRCGRCESEFESTEAHMGKVECPDCGSHDLRTVATG